MTEGGAINPGGTGTLTFINCTLADNSVESSAGGGAIATETEPASGPVNLINCILWQNLAAGNPKQIEDPVNMVSVTYSDVQGGWGVPMDMNIDDDPFFVAPGDPDENYRLAADSPCIDVGNPLESIIPCDQFDLDNDGDTCDPPNNYEPTPDLDLGDRIVSGTVDMGAYESVPCPADFNGDCRVDIKDLLFLLGEWFSCEMPCPPSCPADLDGSCAVDVKDLLVLLGAWGPCPCAPHAEVPLLDEVLADACVSEENWDEFEGVMTSSESSQEEKDNYLCWMEHHLFDCTCWACRCCPACPGPDPYIP